MHRSFCLVALFSALGGVDAAFNFEEHLGNAGPPYTPSFNLNGGLGTGMPGGCSVEQTHRHGSRGPVQNDYPYIANLSAKLNDPAVAKQLDSLNLPSEWKFVQGPNRWSNVLQMNNLTIVGRKENFDDGVKFRLAYPTLPFQHIRTGDQDRVRNELPEDRIVESPLMTPKVEESARWFRAGMFGRYEDEISSLSIIPEDNVIVSSIVPMGTCTKYTVEPGLNRSLTWEAIYVPPIQQRINSILHPVQLTTDEVLGALFACPYEIATFENTTWCNVFEENEILNFEYDLDLLIRGLYGYDLPGNMPQVLGSLYVNELVDRLTASDANKTYVDYGHDLSITIALTGLGLAKDDRYPATGPPNPTRAWQTSKQVPFGAHMVWEKWNCGSSTQIRMLLNGAPFSLSPVCDANKQTGACLLDDFVNGTAPTRSIKWGDATWNATCGNPGV